MFFKPQCFILIVTSDGRVLNFYFFVVRFYNFPFSFHQPNVHFFHQVLISLLNSSLTLNV